MYLFLQIVLLSDSIRLLLASDAEAPPYHIHTQTVILLQYHPRHVDPLPVRHQACVPGDGDLPD